jgi:heme-degrading monooxygenase HmoA
MTTDHRQPARADEDHPIVVLVEWPGGEMGLGAADQMARDSLVVLDQVPGLEDVRFFGDFDGGTHCFLLTWRSREAMERYMASEAMHAVREAAMPFVAGKPIRRVFVEYGARTTVARDTAR